MKFKPGDRVRLKQFRERVGTVLRYSEEWSKPDEPAWEVAWGMEEKGAAYYEWAMELVEPVMRAGVLDVNK